METIKLNSEDSGGIYIFNDAAYYEYFILFSSSNKCAPPFRIRALLSNTQYSTIIKLLERFSDKKEVSGIVAVKGNVDIDPALVSFITDFDILYWTLEDFIKKYG